MKNKKTILVVVLLAICLACLVACKSGGGKLTSPEITLEGNVVSWKAVEHADSYSVKVGSDAAVSVTTTSYTINKTAVGSYKVTVTAKSSDDKYTDSDPSNEVTYTVTQQQPIDKTPLAKPVLSLSGNVVSWQAVPYAASYAVTVGGKAAVTVTATTYTVTETAIGSYDITVVAKANDDAHSDSDPSEKVTYVVSQPTEKTALAAPVITLNGNKVAWAAVENAASYAVTVGNKAAVEVNRLEYVIPETAVGRYDVTVVAKAAADSELYKDSAASNKVTYVIEQEIELVLEEIDLENANLPSKIYLDQGITVLDLTSLVIVATFDNGSHTDLSVDDDGVSVSSYDITTVGDKEITISYTYKGVTKEAVLRLTVAERGINDIDEYDAMLIEYNATGNYAIDGTVIRNMRGENMLDGGAVALPQGKTLLSVDNKFVVVTVARFVYDEASFLAISQDMSGYYVLTSSISFESKWHAGPYIGAAPLMADTNLLDYENGIGEATADNKGQLGVPFTGTLDGQGYALCNIKLSCSELYNSYLARGNGIIGYVGETGVVKNITLRNVYVSTGKYSSFLVGYNKGTIENICVEADCAMHSQYSGGALVAGYNDGTVKNVVSYVAQYEGFNNNQVDFWISNDEEIESENKVLSGLHSNSYIFDKTDLSATLGDGWKYFEGHGTVLANNDYVLIPDGDRNLPMGGKLYLNLLFVNGDGIQFMDYSDKRDQFEVKWDAERGSHYVVIKNLSETTLVVGDTIKITANSGNWKYSYSIVIEITAAAPTAYETATTTLEVVEGMDIDLTTIDIKVTYTDDSTKTVHPTKVEGYNKNGTVGLAQTVKAFYGEGENDYVEITVTIIAKSVTSISIDESSTHASVYNVGDALDISGAKIKVNYNNNTSEVIAITTAMLTASDYNMSAAGVYQVTVTYGGYTCKLSITVNAVGVTVESIAVVGNIAKTTYLLNETVTAEDIVGATITATNSDNSTTPNIAITIAMISYNFNTVGSAQITVTYEGQNATIDVTVVDYAEALTVNAANTTLTYNATTTLDLVANATYTLTMASGATQPVATGITASEYKAGLNTITYTYTDEYATIKATQQYEIWYEITGNAVAEWAVMQGNLAGYYRLTGDLDFGNANITSLGKQPIKGGDETTCNVDDPFDDSLVQKGVPFTGKFDGDGYSIMYFKVEGSSFDGDGFGLSLFGYVGATGEVKNFTVKNASVKSKNHTGFIATVNEGLIENIVIDSTCAITANWLTAGVVVFNKGEAIVCNVVCYVATAVKEDNVTIGDLVVIHTNYATAQNCYAISNENFLTDSEVLADIEGWAFIEDYGPVYGKYVIAMPESTAPQGGKATFRIYHSDTFLIDYINIWGVSEGAAYPTKISDTDGVYVGTFNLKDDMTMGQSYTVGLRVNGKYVTYKLTVTEPAQEGL